MSLRSAYAEGTLANIRRQVSRFQHFCREIGDPSMPADLQTLLMYVQDLTEEFASVDTIVNYLQGVKIWHQIEGHRVDNFEHFLMKLLLRGCRRQAQYKPKQALPITPKLLLQMYDYMQVDTAQGATIWCLFLFAFFLVSRKSNLVPDGVKKFDHKKQLTRGNIKVRSDALLVTLDWTKTIQYNQRKLVVPLVAIPDSKLCPVKAYKTMCTMMPAGENEPAFQFLGKRGETQPVTYQQFQRAIKRTIESVGRDPAKFSTHSFRRGGATFAYESGVPADTVKLMGDWQSDCYRAYLQVSMACKTDAALKIARRISSIENSAF